MGREDGRELIMASRLGARPPFKRPAGTRTVLAIDPAINHRATIKSPSGTKNVSIPNNPHLRAILL
jgi:hypothetical protein